jgi:hypothetical protein
MQQKDFAYGVKQVDLLNYKYNVSMDTYPKNLQKIELMIADFGELRKLQLQEGQEPFEQLVDYRLLNLEAEKLFIQGQKYDESGTTKKGFGCKLRPLIIESVYFRNKSALRGFEAADLLLKFVAKYPEESKSAGLSPKNALFLNATFYQVSRDARQDSGVINRFCPENATLELYKEELKKKTNMSEDFINKLGYEEAVPIWKKTRGIE